MCWAASTPPSFRFSVKVPQAITHSCRLIRAEDHINQFLEEIGGLGEKLGPLLVQLPPSLNFDASIAEPFFQRLRLSVATSIVCEPRHASWFTARAERLFERFAVTRAVVDPAPVAAAAELDASSAMQYFRLHGSPRMYYSSYDQGYLDELADRLSQLATGNTTWCIFDNTAIGAATMNALAVQERIASTPTVSVASDQMRQARDNEVRDGQAADQENN